jgi:putative membrane protein
MNRNEFIRLSLFSSLMAVSLRISAVQAAAEVTAAQFVELAGTAGTFEIASSEIAAAKAQEVAVKAFAEQIIKDHTAAAKELTAIAGSKYTVPAQLDAEHQKLIDELKTSGQNLDAAYVEMQVDAHKEAVGLFTAYGENGDDAALQAFAVKTLPMLQMHYEMIKKISITPA